MTDAEFQESIRRYGNELAPEGQVFVCATCGKQSRDRYGYRKISQGWDESCMLNAVLCYEKKPGDTMWTAVPATEKPE